MVIRKRNFLLVSLLFIITFFIYALTFDMYQEANSKAVESPKRIILLDAGHGGEDPGATSDVNGIKEKDFNLTMAKKLKKLLTAKGMEVIMTREDDVLKYDQNASSMLQKRKQDLTQRKKIIDESSADIVVSIHLNKFPDAKYKGAQVFYPHKSNESQTLALNIQKSIRENVDPQNKREALLRGKANELPIIIFRDIKKPTIVVECGFLSNPEEEAILITPEYQDKLANGILVGITNYFNQISNKSQ
jgi:N-acetylmuramoyl-L-alanine amidase